MKLRKNQWVTGCVMISALMGVPSEGHSPVHKKQYQRGRETLLNQAGCFRVGSTFKEEYSFDPDYTIAPEPVTIPSGASVREWIYALEINDYRVRLEHVIQSQYANGTVTITHGEAEDWEYGASWDFEFFAPMIWARRTVFNDEGRRWTRRVTSVDGGLNYQCTALWDFSGPHPSWKCNETRAPIFIKLVEDFFGTKDVPHRAMVRSVEITAHVNSFLQKQENIKLKRDKTGVERQLVKEVGEIGLARISPEECAVAEEYAEKRKKIWDIQRISWDKALEEKKYFKEREFSERDSRFEAMRKIEERYLTLDLSHPETVNAAERDFISLIDYYSVMPL